MKYPKGNNIDIHFGESCYKLWINIFVLWYRGSGVLLSVYIMWARFHFFFGLHFWHFWLGFTTPRQQSSLKNFDILRDSPFGIHLLLLPVPHSIFLRRTSLRWAFNQQSIGEPFHNYARGLAHFLGLNLSVRWDTGITKPNYGRKD